MPHIARTAPWVLMGVIELMAAGASHAQTVVYSGRLDDPGNAALTSSSGSAAAFGNAQDVANNVALYALNMPIAGLLSIVSTGFASGGIDPYFTIFKGNGVASTFVDSNDVQAFSTGGDFSYSASLAAGNYTISLGAFANMSFAENLGVGTLGDGFTALGAPAYTGNTSYRLVVTTPVPEPAIWLLLGLGLALLLQHRQRHTAPA